MCARCFDIDLCRTYMSMVDPTSQTKYTCKVEDAGDGPLVRLVVIIASSHRVAISVSDSF